MLLDLRDYQKRAFDRIRVLIREGHRRILLVAPTGSGKTVTASHLLAGAHKKGNDALFLAHMREIIYQTAEKLRNAHVDFNMVMSGHRQTSIHTTWLASIQTLIKREFSGLNIKFLIIDEAHHAVARTYKRIIAAYPDAIIIGLTATPCRGDGRGLGGIFDSMVVAASVPELIQLGYLVPPRIYSAEVPSNDRLHIRQGDYRMDEASELYANAKLVGDIVDNWCVHAAMQRTIVFATDIRHSLYVRDYFRGSGIDAEHIDGKTPKAERRAIFAGHRDGRFLVLCNVGVATEGYDDPRIEAVVLARPTKSFGLYLQMAGRGLRPAPGKSQLTLLDHAGCWFEHGSPAEPVLWTLDPEGQAAHHRPKHPGSTIDTSWRCENCHYVNEGGQYCDGCGMRRMPTARTPQVAAGHLHEVAGGRGSRSKRSTKSDQEKYWNDCLWKCIQLKKKVGAAFHMYTKRFPAGSLKGFAEMPHGKAEWNMRADEFHELYKQRGAR